MAIVPASPNSPALNVLEISSLIEEERGNVSAIARRVGRRRSKVKEFIDSHVELTALLEEIRESVVDKAEGNLFQMVEEGDGKATRFVLSTLGKSRGYTTRVESSGPNGEPHRHQIAPDLDDESINRIRAKFILGSDSD